MADDGGERQTLTRYLEQRWPASGGDGPDIPSLVHRLADAVREVADEARRAGITGSAAATGGENPTGDAQLGLDVRANRAFIDAFASSRLVAGIVSEEQEELQVTDCEESSRVVLCVDPLDGSDNILVNGCTGSVLAFYQRTGRGPCADVKDEILGSAPPLLAAYALYGPATLLVLTAGERVDGFTLEPSSGELLLTHPRIRCPARGSMYSVNTGHSHQWEPGVRDFVRFLDEVDEDAGRPYTLRYSGALVADLHRALADGGVYLYPADSEHTEGKIRLLYEAIPLAMIAEAAGGAASTGRERILEIERQALHQTVPVALGSRRDVAAYGRFLADATVGGR